MALLRPKKVESKTPASATASTPQGTPVTTVRRLGGRPPIQVGIREESWTDKDEETP